MTGTPAGCPVPGCGGHDADDLTPLRMLEQHGYGGSARMVLDMLTQARAGQLEADARLAEQQADEWRYAPFGAAIARAFRGLADLIRARTTP